MKEEKRNSKIDDQNLNSMQPAVFRELVRNGDWTKTTEEACEYYGQANLVALPQKYAFDFLAFCTINPSSCLVSDIAPAGLAKPLLFAPLSDLRTDLPRYRVFEDGNVVDEPNSVLDYWRDDLVAFIIGASRSFIWAFRKAKLHNRFLGAYTTSIELNRFGRFSGHMVCTCQAFPDSEEAIRAIKISSRYSTFHGSPVHIGDPSQIGISDIGSPDAFIPPWPAPPPENHEILLYWGCGITPQNVILESNIDFAITHYPGHMFVLDKSIEELSVI